MRPWCHIAVPHGRKNRTFLVNLNDVGPEAGQSAGPQRGHPGIQCCPSCWRAALKIRNFAPPGSWVQENCGGSGSPGNGLCGLDWMRDSSENCKSVP